MGLFGSSKKKKKKKKQKAAAAEAARQAQENAANYEAYVQDLISQTKSLESDLAALKQRAAEEEQQYISSEDISTATQRMQSVLARLVAINSELDSQIMLVSSQLEAVKNKKTRDMEQTKLQTQLQADQMRLALEYAKAGIPRAQIPVTSTAGLPVSGISPSSPDDDLRG